MVSITRKNIPIIVCIIVVAVIGVYFAWRFSVKKTPEKSTADLSPVISPTPTSLLLVGELPEINPLSNPLEKLPETNPIEQTNPFSNLKTNPFR